jgi:hypothetical protein
MVIERPEFPAVRRTSAEKARWQRYYESLIQWNPGSSFEVEEIHPTISGLWFQEDGTLWVQSSAGTWRTHEGELAAFDVYDRTGRFVRQVRLRGPGVPGEDQVFLAGDRVYVITQFFDTVTSADPVDPNARPSRLIAYSLEEIP